MLFRSSDQGSQHTSSDWQTFLKSHNLVCSMSRRGNCYDNAVAESFFQLLKRERIKRKTYKDREEARQDIFRLYRDVLQPDPASRLYRLSVTSRVRKTPFSQISECLKYQWRFISWTHPCRFGRGVSGYAGFDAGIALLTRETLLFFFCPFLNMTFFSKASNHSGTHDAGHYSCQ